MKKLVILSAVAALAAFGWVNAPRAGALVAAGTSCDLINMAGLAADVYTLDTGDVGQEFSTFTFIVVRANGNVRSERIDNIVPGVPFPFALTNVHGFGSLAVGDAVMLTAKPKDTALVAGKGHANKSSSHEPETVDCAPTTLQD